MRDTYEISSESLQEFIQIVNPTLNERQSRIFLGALSSALGTRCNTLVQQLSGADRKKIIRGKKDAEELKNLPKEEWPDFVNQVRESGAGRKSITVVNHELIEAVKKLVEPHTVGNPENPLTWTTKSLRHIQSKLIEQGFNISHTSVGNILVDLGYSLQQNLKYISATESPVDRDKQFQRINGFAKKFHANKDPVISVDAKKKELIGNYKNQGAEYCPKGQPIKVLDHDFGTEKAAPYGIYDCGANKGFVSVGSSADTAAFAVNSIGLWWKNMGEEMYPDCTRVMITADCGGSNSCRSRLWKSELQELANKIGRELWVFHYPPGTSKWNKIEHRMFCHMSKNTRGRPLVSMETIIKLIANCTTSTGLNIKCVQDTNTYAKGIKVSNDTMDKLNIKHSKWHGEWFYIIKPQNQQKEVS